MIYKGGGINILFTCILYPSDAADELLCVDLGGRRNLKQIHQYITHQQNPL